MIKDITIPEVKNIRVAVTKTGAPGETPEWKVYLINSNPFPVENTLVASRGYGEVEGEQQKTSVLRHFLETVPANSSAIIENIDPAVFHLHNEYWVSYYIGGEIFDRRFVFVPGSICEENLSFIKELNEEGVLHS